MILLISSFGEGRFLFLEYFGWLMLMVLVILDCSFNYLDFRVGLWYDFIMVLNCVDVLKFVEINFGDRIMIGYFVCMEGR